MAQSINSLKNLKNFSKWFSKDVLTKTLVDSLLEEGKKIIRKAYESRDWKNKTGNLHDSYVAVVINNGVPVKYAKFNKMAQSVVGNFETKGGDGFSLSGSQEVDNFVKSYASRYGGNQRGVRLVVAAVMYYASILEAGNAPLKHKYKVISHVRGDLNEIKKRGIPIKTNYFKGSLVINNNATVQRSLDVDKGGSSFAFKSRGNG